VKTIYKYEIRSTDVQVVMMPEDAKILTVQTQHGTPCLWVGVVVENPEKERTIKIYGTGRCLPENPGEYIGTYQLATRGRGLVFHVYELRKSGAL